MSKYTKITIDRGLNPLIPANVPVVFQLNNELYHDTESNNVLFQTEGVHGVVELPNFNIVQDVQLQYNKQYFTEIFLTESIATDLLKFAIVTVSTIDDRENFKARITSISNTIVNNFETNRKVKITLHELSNDNERVVDYLKSDKLVDNGSSIGELYKLSLNSTTYSQYVSASDITTYAGTWLLTIDYNELTSKLGGVAVTIASDRPSLNWTNKAGYVFVSNGVAQISVEDAGFLLDVGAGNYTITFANTSILDIYTKLIPTNTISEQQNEQFTDDGVNIISNSINYDQIRAIFYLSDLDFIVFQRWFKISTATLLYPNAMSYVNLNPTDFETKEDKSMIDLNFAEISINHKKYDL